MMTLTQEIVALLRARANGRERRMKLEFMAVVLGFRDWQHGNATDVAIRNAVSDLVNEGCPLASEPGPDGGVWWIGNEDERRGALALLHAQVRALTQRIKHLEVASLDGWTPRQSPLPF